MSNHNFSIEGRALAEPKIYEANPDGTARSYAVELLTFMGDRPTVIIESDGRLPEGITEELKTNPYIHDVMIVQS